MALRVKDLLKLKDIRDMELIAGKEGLDRIVVTSNIADYEFAPGIRTDDSMAFEAHSFVVSSLLYARGNKDIIFSSVKSLYECNASAFAFKDVIYEKLPLEVIDFANENNFPIFKFSAETYFENVIFQIMNAVQHDDNHYLQEDNISLMIKGVMAGADVSGIARGLSIKFSEYAVGAYIKNKEENKPLNIEYLHKLFLTSKSLRGKAIISTYKGGLFLLMTGRDDDNLKYEILLKQVLEFLSLPQETLRVTFSQGHKPYESLDRCFRESYHCYIASKASEKNFRYYRDMASYQLTLALAGSKEYKEYEEAWLGPFTNKRELEETIFAWIDKGGNLQETAAELGCHVNTVRYRIAQIKQILKGEDKSDYELFALLSPAVQFRKIKKGLESRQ